MLLSGSLIAACGSAPVAGEPEFAPVSSASARAHRAVSRGVDTLLDLPSISLRLRYNPAPCECPVWEIELYGRWERVAVIPAREATLSVEPFLTYDEHPEGSVFVAEVGLNVERSPAPNGWNYRLFEIRDLSDTP